MYETARDTSVNTHLSSLPVPSQVNERRAGRLLCEEDAGRLEINLYHSIMPLSPATLLGGVSNRCMSIQENGTY
jgi:hypothetical protein